MSDDTPTPTPPKSPDGFSFVVTPKLFRPILALLKQTIPSRGYRAQLKYITLKAAKGKVGASATDLDVGLRIRCEGMTATSSGEAVIDYESLEMAIKHAPTNRDGQSKVTWRRGKDGAPDNWTWSAGNKSLSTPLESGELVPGVLGWSADSWFSVTAHDLKEMIEKTWHACDCESTIYALGGVLLRVKDGTLVAVATSGRVAEEETRSVLVHGEPVRASLDSVIPLAACKLLVKLLDRYDDSVRIAATYEDPVGAGDTYRRVFAQSVIFRTKHASLYARCCNGFFAPYEDVFLPSGQDDIRLSLSHDPHAFDAIRRILDVAKTHEDKLFPTMDVRIANNRFAMSATGKKGITLKESFAVVWGGPEATFIVRPNFLLDSLAVHDEPELRLRADKETIDICSATHRTAIALVQRERAQGEPGSDGVYIHGLSRCDGGGVVYTAASAFYDNANITTELAEDVGRLRVIGVSGKCEWQVVRKVFIKPDSVDAFDEQVQAYKSAGYDVAILKKRPFAKAWMIRDVKEHIDTHPGEEMPNVDAVATGGCGLVAATDPL
jgi:DNA polymerase-3 subunit beta